MRYISFNPEHLYLSHRYSYRAFSRFLYRIACGNSIERLAFDRFTKPSVNVFWAQYTCPVNANTLHDVTSILCIFIDMIYTFSLEVHTKLNSNKHICRHVCRRFVSNPFIFYWYFPHGKLLPWGILPYYAKNKSRYRVLIPIPALLVYKPHHS